MSYSYKFRFLGDIKAIALELFLAYMKHEKVCVKLENICVILRKMCVKFLKMA